MEALGRQYISYAKKDSEAIDLFLSGCRWCTELYRRLFWDQGEILERGIPKNDLYFTDRAFIREKVLAYLDVLRIQSWPCTRLPTGEIRIRTLSVQPGL